VYQTRKIGALVPPGSGGDRIVAATDAAKLTSAVSGLRGTLYWSSNRFGNHEILALSLPGMEQRRLTDHPHADFFPRVSPDGKKLAFCRSQLEWVSQRDVLAWDLMLMDLGSGATSVVATDSVAPSWSSDGRFLYYQHRGSEVMEYSLATGSHRLLFKSGIAPIPEGSTINEPAYNPLSGQLAAAFRGSLRVITLFSASGKGTAVSDGCETAWSPDYSFLYYVQDRSGNKGTSIRKYDPAMGRSSLWLDVPGEWSHEYFPKLSWDGDYLVFGASTGGHEHDSADYEIFLWEVGAPDSEIVRVTFHSGNDAWPDIWLEK
jgi:Tol biopolymer transport system component